MFALNVNTQIKLKLLNISDAEDLFALIDEQRSHLGEWLPWVKYVQHVADSETFIRNCREDWDNSVALHLGVIFDYQLRGMIGFHRLDRQRKTASIGYWLSRNCTGNGIMLRCCAALIEFGFRESGLQRIEIHCAEENKASRSIPERLGFTTEGVRRNAELLDSGTVDLVCYSLLESRWAGVPALLAE